MTRSEAGRLGGIARAARLSAERRREIARMGGAETVKRHGAAHMQAIGAAGFGATVARHRQGDRAGYVRRLHDLGHLQAIESAADAEIDRQLAAGAAVASVELPCPDNEEVPY